MDGTERRTAKIAQTEAHLAPGGLACDWEDGCLSIIGVKQDSMIAGRPILVDYGPSGSGNSPNSSGCLDTKAKSNSVRLCGYI